MGTHRIEGAAKVYLLFNTETGRWEVDTLCFDGRELDSAYEEIAIPECDDEEDDDEHDDVACALTRQTARDTPLPTGHRLIALLRLAQERRARDELD